MIQEIKKTVASIQIVSGLVLFACLPVFFNNVTRWAMYLFIAFSLLDYFLQKRYQQESFFTLNKAPFWACIAYFLLLIIYIPFEEYTRYVPLFIESRLSFLVFGILGILGTRVPKIKYVAYTCIIVSIGLLLYTLYLSHIHPPAVGSNWKRHLIMVRHTYIHAHMAFNMYLNIAIAACFWLIKTQKNKLKYAWLLLVALFYVAIAISDARIGFAACNLLIVIGIYYLLGERHKKATIGVLLVCGILGGAILLNNHKVKRNIETNQDTRYDIWSESVALLKEHPLTGVGASTNITYITNAFIASPTVRKDRFLIYSCVHEDVMGAHPHNQLLQSTMEFGIFGLICMGCILLLPVYYGIKNKSDLLIVACWILVIIQMQTEVIRGSYGDLAFGIYLLFTMYYAKHSTKEIVGSV